MAQTYSVKAVLSAYDAGFTKAMKQAGAATDSLGKKAKSGFGFGVFAGIGMQAFSAVTNGVKGLISEIDTSNAAWKTFGGNMKILGKTDKQINAVKKSMQSYAEATIYSSSDMASTYSQLEAVGVKSADKLVTGLGGLAAAAENPTQAMKTLSQQATQMAGKPTVAWQDFKLMMEQTPAGIAAVAKEMGMSTKEMVKKIQDGEIATEDFFKAVEKVGNSKGFKKLAMQYKTVGQAMGGLKETLANKLGPAFDVVSNKAIKGLEKIIAKVGKIDGEKLANKVAKGIAKAQPYLDMFKTALGIVGGALKKVGKFLLDNSEAISKALPWVLGLVGAYKAFKVINGLVPGMMRFTSAIMKLASGGIGAIAGKLFGIAKGEKAAGKAGKASAGQVMAAAKSFFVISAAVLLAAAGFGILTYSAIKLAAAGPLAIGVMFGLVAAMAALGFGMTVMIKTLAPMSGQIIKVAAAFTILGAAVILIAAGFALLAFAAISLANAGGLAIACMVGMIAAIALLAVGAAALGPALTVGAGGFIAFGAAILMVGAGLYMACAGMTLLATQLPVIAEYGLQAAVSIVALGGSMIVFAVGALLAGTASMVLGVGLLLVGAGALVAAVGVMALAVGALLLGVALMMTAASVMIIASTLPMAASGAFMCLGAFASLLGISVALGAVLLLVGAGLVLTGGMALLAAAGILAFGIGAIVASAGTLVLAGALKAVNSSLKTISKNAKSTAASLKAMQNSVKVVEAGLDALGSKAQSAMNKLISAFNNAASKAKSAGQKVGNGFTTGMKSGLNKAPAAASKAVSNVNSRLRSGRSGAYSAGAYISQGFAAGMLSCLGTIRAAASQMAAAADAAIRAKARIHSPSRVTLALGKFFGGGFVKGIRSKYKMVRKASDRLVSIPKVQTPDFAMSYNGEMSNDYIYTNNPEYRFEIPFEIDGRRIAKATATYTKEELDKMRTRASRKHGRV